MTSNTTEIPNENEALANQDYYYSRLEKDHFWFASRQNFLDILLVENSIDLSGKHGLEIGCGNSLVSSQLENRYNCKVDGIDLTNSNFRFPTKGQFFQIDITQSHQELKRKYDFIVLFDIIEHIENPKEFVSKAADFLKPNGFIFVNVPAYNAFYSRYDEVAGHVRRYDSKLVREHLLETDKKVTEISLIFWGFFFVPLLVVRKILLSIVKNKTNEEIYHLGFTPPNRIINGFLKWLGYIEKQLFLGTGFGTSVMGVFQLKDSERS